MTKGHKIFAIGDLISRRGLVDMGHRSPVILWQWDFVLAPRHFVINRLPGPQIGRNQWRRHTTDRDTLGSALAPIILPSGRRPLRNASTICLSVHSPIPVLMSGVTRMMTRFLLSTREKAVHLGSSRARISGPVAPGSSLAFRETTLSTSPLLAKRGQLDYVGGRVATVHKEITAA